MAITDVKDCVMLIIVVTVQGQEKGNVHVVKLVSVLSGLLLSFESPAAGLKYHRFSQYLHVIFNWQQASRMKTRGWQGGSVIEPCEGGKKLECL